MNSLSLEKCRALLDVKERDDWQTIQRAYKTQVQFFHPDRFTHDPDLQAKAEVKLKQLNQAFAQLKTHLHPPTAPNMDSGYRFSATHDSQTDTHQPSPSPQEVSRAYREHQNRREPQLDSKKQPPPPKPRVVPGLEKKWALALAVTLTLALVGLLYVTLPRPVSPTPEDMFSIPQSDPILWKDVLSDPRYQQLETNQQKSVKRHWFRTYPLQSPYMQSLSAQGQKVLEDNFVEFDRWDNIPFIE